MLRKVDFPTDYKAGPGKSDWGSIAITFKKKRIWRSYIIFFRYILTLNRICMHGHSTCYHLSCCGVRYVKNVHKPYLWKVTHTSYTSWISFNRCVRIRY